MPQEDTRLYWIIPIVSLIIVTGMILPYSVYYNVTVKIPNAELERIDMKKMDCSEIIAKNSINDYWSPQNGKIGRQLSKICIDLQVKDNSGISPFVEFCTPGGYSPDKLIENATHTFNHDICMWELS